MIIDLFAGEKVLAVERRHWLPLVAEITTLLLAALAPGFLLAALAFASAGSEIRALIEEYQTLYWFLYTTWLLGLWMVFGLTMTNYYLDVLVITNRRVIDIEQIGLFSRDTAELGLESVQDIRVEVKGLIPSLLNYGDLYVQTASQHPEFSLKHVHDPHRVRELISEQRAALASNTPLVGKAA